MSVWVQQETGFSRGDPFKVTIMAAPKVTRLVLFLGVLYGGLHPTVPRLKYLLRSAWRDMNCTVAAGMTGCTVNIPA